MTVQCLNINILLHSSSCLWIVIARMRKGKYKHFTFPSDSLRASCYYNSIRLLLYGNEKFVSSCLPVEHCRKTIHPISSLCGRHTRVCACAWKREKEREREKQQESCEYLGRCFASIIGREARWHVLVVVVVTGENRRGARQEIN